MSHSTAITVAPDQLSAVVEKSVSAALAKHQHRKQPEYYTRQEVADLFKCSLPTVYNWTVQGKLTAYGIGNRVLYKVEQVHNSLIKL